MATSALAELLEDRALVDDVRELSRVNNRLAALAIARQWLVILATVAIALYVDRWWAYLPAIVVIAAKQHALGILMHDATHYRLFTSRFANEYVSNFLCAFPMVMSTQGYRGEHLQHHLATNTLDDPYYRMFLSDSVWHWPKSRWAAFRQLLGDVSGWNTFATLRMFRRWTPTYQWLVHRNDPQLASRCRIDFLCSIAFWGAVAVGLAIVDGWVAFLLLWAVPALTFYPLFVRLRWISEHPYHGDEAPQGYETRHVGGSLWERICIAPLNINYHIAHHLFPATPFYALPRVHERLMQNPIYREEGERFHTYLGAEQSIRAELIVQ